MGNSRWVDVRARMRALMPEDDNPDGELCGHCGKVARGYGWDGARLCHPDEGMDCYRLVTVYKHPRDAAGNCPRCMPGLTMGSALPFDEPGEHGMNG